MINALICGINGKMGKTLAGLIENDDKINAVCGIDLAAKEGLPPVYAAFNDVKESVDVIIDFSSPAVLDAELEWAIGHKCPVVLAATGYTPEQFEKISRASEKIAVFKTGNFSVGINLLMKLVKKAAEALDGFDVEIIEKHHNQKADAPSGTALMLADSVNAAYAGGKPYVMGRSGIVGKRGGEIGIHAVRGGTIVGEHEVLFAGEDEIITITHSARSKRIFAAGAIKAAKWLAGKPAGLYDMSDVLG